MKNITKAIFFLALFIAAGSARAAVFQISIALPAESLITQDLDARDALNRPIPRSAAHVQLIELWSRTLNKMVLNSLTPSRIKLLALLNSTWDGFAGGIRTAAQQIWHSIKNWLNEKKFEVSARANLSASGYLFVSLAAPIFTAGDSFSFLIQFVIASTRLLR